MAEFFGAIQRGLGSGLNGIYELTGSYAVAIILLTAAVRALLLPLTIKQTRSMKKMQEVAPQTKELQRKFKERQAKAKDRAELQQLRMEMNKEMQELYRASGVNPLGGCLPLLAQMPVFIAMFSIMRAAIPLTGAVALPDGGPVVEATFGGDLGLVVCRPFDKATETEVGPYAYGDAPSAIRCVGQEDLPPVVLDVVGLVDHLGLPLEEAPWISECAPSKVESASGEEVEIRVGCRSALGTGHVPLDSPLFKDLSKDQANIFGLSPGCSANEVGSRLGIRRCTSTQDESGAGGVIPYWVLVGLIVLTAYYQTKQMQSKQTTQMADQQKMMLRIMPIFFGFISLQIPTGANTYFLASNTWQIGQQFVMFRGQGKPAAGGEAKVEKEQPRPDERAPKQKPSQQGKPSGRQAAQEVRRQKQTKQQRKKKKRRR